jgi:alkyl hydroperoxide reductase subunit D
MDFINPIVQRIPDSAKDIRLNLDSVLSRSSLQPEDALGVAIAASFAARSAELLHAFKSAAPGPIGNAAVSAASLMGMNNVWYPFVEMAGDDDLATLRPELRMNAYAIHGGIARAKFEAYALAASIVGKCRHCVQSHYEVLKKEGWSLQQLRDIGRIAAVVNAAALVLASQQEPTAA